MEFKRHYATGLVSMFYISSRNTANTQLVLSSKESVYKRLIQDSCFEMVTGIVLSLQKKLQNQRTSPVLV